MSATPEIPAAPGDAEGPVFDEPWQARAFAIVVKLCEDGAYPWDDFRDRLIAEIGAAGVAGDDSTGYFEHWLAACEKLLAARGVVTVGELADRKDDIAANRPPPTHAVANPVAVDPPRRS